MSGTYLARHDDVKDALPDIRVHALSARELGELLVALGLLGLELQGLTARLGLFRQRIASPCGTNEPPLAARRRGSDLGERDSQRFRRGAYCRPNGGQVKRLPRTEDGTERKLFTYQSPFVCSDRRGTCAARYTGPENRLRPAVSACCFAGWSIVQP